MKHLSAHIYGKLNDGTKVGVAARFDAAFDGVLDPASANSDAERDMVRQARHMLLLFYSAILKVEAKLGEKSANGFTTTVDYNTRKGKQRLNAEVALGDAEITDLFNTFMGQLDATVSSQIHQMAPGYNLHTGESSVNATQIRLLKFFHQEIGGLLGASQVPAGAGVPAKSITTITSASGLYLLALLSDRLHSWHGMVSAQLDHHRFNLARQTTLTSWHHLYHDYLSIEKEISTLWREMAGDPAAFFAAGRDATASLQACATKVQAWHEHFNRLGGENAYVEFYDQRGQKQVTHLSELMTGNINNDTVAAFDSGFTGENQKTPILGIFGMQYSSLTLLMFEARQLSHLVNQSQGLLRNYNAALQKHFINLTSYESSSNKTLGSLQKLTQQFNALSEQKNKLDQALIKCDAANAHMKALDLKVVVDEEQPVSVRQAKEKFKRDIDASRKAFKDFNAQYPIANKLFAQVNDGIRTQLADAKEDNVTGINQDDAPDYVAPKRCVSTVDREVEINEAAVGFIALSPADVVDVDNLRLLGDDVWVALEQISFLDVPAEAGIDKFCQPVHGTNSYGKTAISTEQSLLGHLWETVKPSSLNQGAGTLQQAIDIFKKIKSVNKTTTYITDAKDPLTLAVADVATITLIRLEDLKERLTELHTQQTEALDIAKRDSMPTQILMHDHHLEFVTLINSCAATLVTAQKVLLDGQYQPTSFDAKTDDRARIVNVFNGELSKIVKTLQEMPKVLGFDNMCDLHYSNAYRQPKETYAEGQFAAVAPVAPVVPAPGVDDDSYAYDSDDDREDKFPEGSEKSSSDDDDDNSEEHELTANEATRLYDSGDDDKSSEGSEKSSAEETAGLAAEEAERLAAEEAERLAAEEAERLAAEEAERLAAEEAERLAAEEAERLAAEETARLAAEETARLAAEETARLAAEEAERLAAEETARLAAEETQRLAAEETQRLAAEETQRLAAEETARLAAEETQRLAAEETQRLAAEETQRLAAEETQRLAAEETQRLAAEANTQTDDKKPAAENIEKVDDDSDSDVDEATALAAAAFADALTDEADITDATVTKDVDITESRSSPEPGHDMGTPSNSPTGSPEPTPQPSTPASPKPSAKSQAKVEDDDSATAAASQQDSDKNPKVNHSSAKRRAKREKKQANKQAKASSSSSAPTTPADTSKNKAGAGFDQNLFAEPADSAPSTGQLSDEDFGKDFVAKRSPSGSASSAGLFAAKPAETARRRRKSRGGAVIPETAHADPRTLPTLQDNTLDERNHVHQAGQDESQLRTGSRSPRQ